MTAISCNKKNQPVDTPTEGNLTVYCAESFEPTVSKIADDFMGLYSKAHIKIVAVPTRVAIAKLLNNETRLIVCSRPFNQDELNVIKKYDIEVDSLKVALDGVAVIVNHRNSLKQINTDQIRDIFSGKTTEWQKLGVHDLGRIIPALESPNSGTVEYVKDRILGNENYSEVYPCSTMANVYSFVMDHQGAIGFISSDWLNAGPSRVHSASAVPKALEVAEVDSSSIKYVDPNTLGSYYYPYPAHIGRHYYPLTRPVYFYSCDYHLGLASGFLTYAAGNRGQKIFLDDGLVPMVAPVNYVQLNNQPL